MGLLYNIDAAVTINIVLSHFLAVKSFVELVRFIFTIPGVKFFLSRRICQDPIEIFLGCQRQRGRTRDNPNIQEFLKNTQALRVVIGFCRDVTKGNCRGNKATGVTAGHERKHSTAQEKTTPGEENLHLRCFIVANLCTYMHHFVFFKIIYRCVMLFHRKTYVLISEYKHAK